MPSQFFGLNIGASALSAFQTSVNTAANNVANVQTKGYTRQTANLAATDPIRVYTRYGSVGTGVEVTSVTQERNLYYDEKYWQSNSSRGFFEQKLYYVDQVQTIFRDDEQSQKGFSSIFSQMFKDLDTLKTQGNLNNEIGVPQMLFRLEDSHTAAVIEMGMNHFGEISRLTRAVAPTVGLITNIGVSHIENLGSRAGILQAKLEILEGMAPDAPLIVNMDNDMLRTVKLGDRPLLTFAIDDQSADFTATDIAEQGSTTTFTVHHSAFTQPVTIPTVGIHNVYNALAAMAVGYVTGVDPAAAASALANYVPAGMRQNLVQVGGVQVIEDCYNASPDSMRAALQTLGKLPVRRRYAVLGAMLELGDYAKEAHTQVGKMAAENGIDGVLAYGADAAYIVEAAKQAGLENARLFDTKEALAQSLAQQVQPGDGVLFKGSRGMHLEDVMHTVYERWEKA